MRSSRCGARARASNLRVAPARPQAASWLSRAAAAGVAPAQNHYGRLLQEGRGVPQDAALAVEFFEKAAAQGDQDAMVNLGAACLVGKGTARDEARARELVSVAAANGDPTAREHGGRSDVG